MLCTKEEEHGLVPGEVNEGSKSINSLHLGMLRMYFETSGILTSAPLLFSSTCGAFLSASLGMLPTTHFTDEETEAENYSNSHRNARARIHSQTL